MQAKEILEELEDVFEDVFDIDGVELTPEMGPDEIEGWDSLSQIELLIAIEGEFGTKIPIEEAMNIHSVGDIVAAIQKLSE